jgi:site-specific DNA recombinase
MTRDQINSVVERFTSLVAVMRSADPAGKAEIYKGLNLILTYQPGTPRTVRAEARLQDCNHGVMVGVRGGCTHKPMRADGCFVRHGAL